MRIRVSGLLPFVVTVLACSSRAVPEPEQVAASSAGPARPRSASQRPLARSAESRTEAGAAPTDTTIAKQPEQDAEQPEQDAEQPAQDVAGPTQESGQVDLQHACGQTLATPACYAALPAVAECPARFEDVPEGELCGAQGITEARPCSYPEGRCSCVHQEYCGGAVPTFIQHQGMKWQCRPPPAPDACPDAPPRAAAKCSRAGKTCQYGGCGYTTACECSKSRWSCETRHWSPPPSAPPRG